MQLGDAVLAEQRAVDLLADEDVAEFGHQVGEVRAVDDLPARAFGECEVVGKFGVGQDDDVVPALSLADRLDVHVLAAAELTPAGAVAPDFAALDLEANALDRDYEVDLVILEVVGDPLAGNYEVEGLKLFDQRLVDKALGAVGEAWGLGRRDGHRLAGSTPSSQSRMPEPSPLAVLA